MPAVCDLKIDLYRGNLFEVLKTEVLGPIYGRK